MRLLALLTYPFGIREPTGRIARLVLAILFCLVVGVLWIYATDNPAVLNRAIIRAMPHYELREGDAVDLEIDREKGQLLVTKRATGRRLVRDLPAIAAEALPTFTEESYRPLFEKLEGDGLGDFTREEDGSYTVRVVDVDVAGERLRGVGPYPRERPVELGEPVDFVIDFQARQARLQIDRVGRSFNGILGKVPVPAARFPPSLDDYPYLPAIAERAGVGALTVHADATAEEAAHQTARLFRGVVTSLEKARETLGPPHPVEPLTAGEAIRLSLDGRQGVFVLARAPLPAADGEEPRPSKTQTLPIETRMLSPDAIPALTLASYPRLEALMRSDGVRVVEGASGLEAQVGDVEVARTNGLGLERPQALRKLNRQILPSPTEVYLSWDVLWNERDLWGATKLTVQRVLKGFAMAVMVTLPLGLLMGAFGRMASFFEPLRLTGMYLPLPALLPLVLAWRGLTEGAIELFLALCSGVVLLPFVVQSIQDVPQVYLDTSRTLGATRGQQFRFVLMAISWSTLFKGLRVAFAVGWTWMMLAETLGASSGLGYLINTSNRRGYIEHVYIVIVVVIGLAFICNMLWNFIIWMLFPQER